jgi:cyclopropane fatty-acyl-phospholipid synthase-like methyltransferase
MIEILATGAWNEKSRYRADETLCDYLAEGLFKGQTVADFGCGIGLYVQSLRQKGIECVGYDGNPNVSEHPHCYCVDLAVEVDFKIIFDWILCLEVGEHIPKESEQVFIENLHRHNRKGIVLSWAREGQNGTGHVNCQNPDYVIDVFSKLGYVYNAKLTRSVKRKMSIRYIKRNLLIFEKQN